HAAVLPNAGRYHNDNVAVTIRFANSSVGNINYLSNGDRTFPKERCEIFGGGCIAVIDDFRKLQLVRNGITKSERTWLRKDKGHVGEWQKLGRALQNGGAEPI